MIYLDNAATTAVKPDSVKAAILRGLDGNYGNPSRGAHDFSLNAFREVYKCRENAARLFNIYDPLNIALTFNGTDSLNKVIKGAIKPGDHVITTMAEHNSVLRPLYQHATSFEELTIVGLDEAAEIKYEEMFNGIRRNTKAVIVTAASNVTGNGTDIKKISEFTKANNILLIVDASQAAGVLDLDMEYLGIDILCATGHKGLYGPQGTGIVAVRDGGNFKPFITGGAGHHSFSKNHPDKMPDVFEAGTLNTPGIMGLNAGIEYILDKGIENVRNHVMGLERELIRGFREIGSVKLYGNMDNKFRTPCVGINIGNLSSSEVAARLNEDYGIAIRPGAHCAPLVHEALKTKEQGIVRFSLSGFNTLDEVKEAIKAVKEISEDQLGD